MKFNRFIYATMAVALLAACSDKDPLGEGPDNGIGNPGENIGDGYVAVNINLPVQIVTAAPRSANDDFDDGTANEYKVENGALLLFKGANETSAVFDGAYELDVTSWVDGSDNDNITASRITAVKVEVGTINNGEKLYGLVMLNYRNVMNMLMSGKNSEVTLKLKSNDGDAKFNSTNSFDDLVKSISNQDFYAGKGITASNFFMTNAPVSNNVAQTSATAPQPSDISTLVVFTSDAIKKTEAEAKAHPAASVFVERAVAKATLNAKNATVDITASNEDKEEIKDIAINGDVTWALNVTNPTSYIVRNMGDIDFIDFKNSYRNDYRMVGNVKIGTTSIQPITDFYRTYWCLDPNYTVEALATSPLDYVASYDEADFVVAGNTPLYCHENTFNVASQAHNATTQAIVRVAFNLGGEGDGTFFTVNGRQDTLYTSAAKAEVFSLNAVLNHIDIKNAISGALDGTGLSITLDGKNYSKYLNVVFTRNDVNGYREITDISFNNDAFTTLSAVVNGETVNAKAPEWTDEQNKSLRDRVNTAYRIAEYKGGVNYYPVRFKHFAGNDANDVADLAPWDPAKLSTLNTDDTGEAYDVNNYAGAIGTADHMWLGRYGMVRNNWYDVNVSAFKSIGAPEIGALEVESDTTPDDRKEAEQWVAFTVNILSWAKRVQNIEL